MTDIQRLALPLALRGRDILGAAKTGSGKTLAFLVPILENMYRMKWSQFDGLGALIIAPTRELAVQIFQVLTKVGKEHAFSAGLVIGGKNVDVEKDRINRMNILVCTPGRLLQHMDETPNFDCSNLQVLVLDEADRILDMGFETTVNAIIDNLPKERQTLLFSATQTKSVRDLARLSLSDPEYVAVHENATHATPALLTQYYVSVPLPEKLDVLYSFMKTHLKTKAIVFFSSCKQVRFVFETFRHMQPGVSLLQLHGKQKQQKRVQVFDEFCRKEFCYLFCTDVAARGLDIPQVNWVLQVDCPEDADTYIHRVGRTARHEQAGKSLLFLLPSEEEAMLQLLKVAKVPIDKINIKVSKKQSVQTQLQNACFKDPEIKYLGQKAFVSYMRSIHLQKHKSVFDVSKLPAEEFAHSLGLPGAPKIKFVKSNEAKNARRAAPTHVSDQEEESSSESEQDKPKTKVDRMFQRKNQNILSDHYTKLVQHDDDTGDFMHLKRADHDLEAIPDVPDPVLTTSAKKKLRKKVIQQYPKGEKLVFDDDGKAHPLYELETMDDYLKRGLPQDQISKHVEQESAKMRDVDVEDQQVAKLKRREKKLKRKMLEKQARQGTAPTAVLGGSDTDDDSEEEEVVVKPYKKPRTATLADEEALALSLLSRS